MEGIGLRKVEAKMAFKIDARDAREKCAKEKRGRL
jgi:hypothetical protein